MDGIWNCIDLPEFLSYEISIQLYRTVNKIFSFTDFFYMKWKDEQPSLSDRTDSISAMFIHHNTQQHTNASDEFQRL